MIELFHNLLILSIYDDLSINLYKKPQLKYFFLIDLIINASLKKLLYNL